MSRTLTERVALSAYQMLVQALVDHQRRHKGEKPRYFVLHPAVWFSVLESPELRLYNTGTDCHSFGGVPVRESNFQGVPVMVDCRGVVQEL